MATAGMLAAALLLVATASGRGVFAGVDYCSIHTFRSNSSWLQFTKEISTREYTVAGAFKSLHCCAKGYRSIEWYKDGRPYPWPGSIILYPDSANQTIYSPGVQAADAGNYSCLVRNDTQHRWHHTRLTLIGASGPDALLLEGGPQYSGLPLFTYQPRDQVVRLGDDARFFCEAFVGRVDLPDAHSSILWRREGEEGNETTTAAPAPTPAPAPAPATTAAPASVSAFASWRQRGVLKKDTSREDEQILGLFLEIRGVRREDLGQYTCLIHSLDFQSVEVPVWLRQAEALPRAEPERAPRRLLLQLAFLLLTALTVAVLALRFGPELRLMARDALARPPADDGKLWDVLLVYAEPDAEFALGLLLPTLEQRLGFRCCVRALPAGCPAAWTAELSGGAERSRRLLVLLSPALLGGDWAAGPLAAALAALSAAHPRPVCVALQPLPPADGKDDARRELAQLTRAVRPVLWAGPAEPTRRAFWTTLRLRLPPPRRPRSSGAGSGPGADCKQQMTALPAPGQHHRPQRSSSHESLEVLV